MKGEKNVRFSTEKLAIHIRNCDRYGQGYY